MAGEKPMTLLYTTRKFFKQIQLYTVLIQVISTIFIDQTPKFHYLKKRLILASKFLPNYYHPCTLMNTYLLTYLLHGAESFLRS